MRGVKSFLAPTRAMADAPSSSATATTAAAHFQREEEEEEEQSGSNNGDNYDQQGHEGSQNEDGAIEEKEQDDGPGWIESASAEQSYPMTSEEGAGTSVEVGLMEESIYDDLPVFADERSKMINQEVKVLEKELEKTAMAVQENEERLRIMQEHLVNVVQEVQHTNMLLDAKKKEEETEEHLKQLVSLL